MAKIIDGKAVAGKIKAELKKEVLMLKNQAMIPGLAVIIVGDDPASRIYVRHKAKTCRELGILSQVYELEQNISQEKLLDLIDSLNNDDKIHGILVQLPLPKHLDEKTVIEKIDSRKDVDCFTFQNMGRLMAGKSTFLPCTPAGIIELIKSENIKIAGRECVVIGRSNIVGKPLAIMLIVENGTITVAHSKTKNLPEVCRRADILISAVGKPGLITADMVKKGAVVIDVGINRDANGKIVGDVDFENVKNVAGSITPVPGGVGPMTIVMLMRNTIAAVKAKIKSQNAK